LEMADTLDTLEEMLQRGDSDATRGDITVLVSAGRSSILLLDGLDSATQRIENGNHAEAQEDLVRATAAFNTLSLAAEDVTSSELQSRTVSIRDTADSAIADLIEAQESHFLEQLESSETTMLQRAQTQRELARLAELSGDNERAAELRSEAESAFSTYSELISNGNENLISARQEREELDNDLFFSIGGIRAFWIGSLSAYNTKSTDILESYDTAVEQFEEAGATERAETAAAEQADIRSSYQTAYRVSLVIGGIFGILLFTLLLWEIRALYRYRLDSEDAVSGDFLLPWDETQ
jgi:hypothetical protein